MGTMKPTDYLDQKEVDVLNKVRNELKTETNLDKLEILEYTLDSLMKSAYRRYKRGEFRYGKSTKQGS